ncbi:MAG: XrtA/PEP-CTERM system TPR-repeat protein PrsT [Pseudomonadota bacterium]
MKRRRQEFPGKQWLRGMLLGCAMVGFAAVSPVQAVDVKASRFYEDALERFGKQDYDGAIIQLKNALQIDHGMLPVQVLLGRALLAKGDVEAAEVAFREAIRLGVNRSEVVLPLASALVGQGKPAALFEQAELSPNGLPRDKQFDLHLLRASARADLGDPRGAIASIEAARAIAPSQPESWIAEVPVRIRAGQLQLARAAADQALALAPNHPDAWYQKASVLHLLGASQEAMAAYARTVKLAPDHIEARIVRVGLFIDLDKRADAAKEIADIMRVTDQDPRAAYLQALLDEREGKAPTEALRKVTNLIDPVPISYVRYRPQLLLLNGLAHYGLKENEKAKAYLESFMQSQRQTAASKLLAKIYLDEGNRKRAIELLEDYLKVNPGDGQAMLLLASSLMATGNHARAATLMREALKTKDSPAYRTALGMSLLRGGFTDNAIDELEAAHDKSPSSARVSLALASLYLETGQARKAVAIAEKLVRQAPKNAEFVNLLGRAKGESGDYKGARKAFEQALQLDRKSISAKLNLARLEIAGKSHAAAESLLDEVLAQDTRNAEANYLKGVIAERQGKSEVAERWLRQANDLSRPGDTRWSLELVNYLLRQGRADAALETAKGLAGKAASDVSVLMALARAQMASRDLIGARNTLTSATKESGYNADQLAEVARLQLLAQNPAGARYSLEKALSSKASHIPSMIVQTELELAEKRYAEAEQWAGKIIQALPRRAIGHQLRGQVALARGQRPLAITAYREAFRLEPTGPVLLELMRVQASEGNEREALQLAEQWISKNPNQFHVLMAVGDIHAQKNRLKEARQWYERALKLRPNDAVVHNNLANVLLRLKDSGALKFAERAVTLAPGDASAIDTLGWILHLSGDSERALPYLRDARLRQPGNAEIRYHLGAVLLKLGNTTQAREELKAALKNGVQFEGKHEAESLLNRLSP